MKNSEIIKIYKFSSLDYFEQIGRNRFYRNSDYITKNPYKHSSILDFDNFNVNLSWEEVFYPFNVRNYH